jgi:hypothetical protein
MVVISALVAVGVAVAWRPGSSPVEPASDVLQASPDARLFVIRLAKVGPRSARVFLDEQDLGELSIDDAGNFSGWATGKLMGQCRRISFGKVEIRYGPGLPEDLAPGVQRLLFKGGVLFSTLVPPDQPEAIEAPDSGH